MVQQPLGSRQHQRLGERPVHLAPQHVEKLQGTNIQGSIAERLVAGLPGESLAHSSSSGKLLTRVPIEPCDWHRAHGTFCMTNGILKLVLTGCRALPVQE